MWGNNEVLQVDYLQPPRAYYVGEPTGAHGGFGVDYVLGADVLGTSVRFAVAASGTVQMSAVYSSTLGVRRAEDCIAQPVRRWSFPQPDGGGIVVVSYPFVFETAN